MKGIGRILLSVARILAIAVLLTITLIPLVWMATTAFKTNSEILVFPPKLFSDNPTLVHFQEIFSEGGTWIFFQNSLIATGVSTILTIALAAPAAYALTAHRFPLDAGRQVSLGLLLLRFLPPFAIVIPLFVFLRSAGLIDSVWALVLVYTAVHLPLAVWIIQPAVAQIPKEMNEAGEVDGAGALKIFWYLTLPLLRPALGTAAAICTIFSWNEFFFALVFTTNQARTYPLLINGFISDAGPEWGAIAATSLLAVIPIIILCLLLQKQLVSGLLTGAGR